MTFQQLRYISAIAKYGSFNEAARHLFVSQSSISTAVKELEQELGISIFIRTSRGTELSPQGQEFMRYNNRLLGVLAEISERYQPSEESSRLLFTVSSQHYLFVEDAFVELVDLVGGVDFDVPMDMDYDDPSQDLYIHLKKGEQHLDGEQAMGLVRFRKGYATQDIQRTKTQQAFLQALARKCLSVVNLSKIGEMVTIFRENVTTDLTVGNLAYFAQELLRCDFETMFSYTLEGEAVMVNDASCYAVYLNKTLDVVNQYFNPYETAITAANVSIRTPEQVRAEQAALEAEREEQNPPEETPSEEELPQENLWTEEDFWIADDFWPGEDGWSGDDLWEDQDDLFTPDWP